jgi:hypothetical protein
MLVAGQAGAARRFVTRHARFARHVSGGPQTARAGPAVVEKRANCAFGRAGRSETRSFERIEIGFRRKEAEATFFGDDDAGGTIGDLDNIGMRHVCMSLRGSDPIQI